jgi:hypothetical protein
MISLTIDRSLPAELLSACRMSNSDTWTAFCDELDKALEPFLPAYKKGIKYLYVLAIINITMANFFIFFGEYLSMRLFFIVFIMLSLAIVAAPFVYFITADPFQVSAVQKVLEDTSTSLSHHLSTIKFRHQMLLYFIECNITSPSMSTTSSSDNHNVLLPTT